MLTGSPEEVGIGWAWETTDWNPDPSELQRYIDQNVRVGDRVKLGGFGAGTRCGIVHRDSKGVERQVGFTSKKTGAGGINNDLMVSAVLRWKYSEEHKSARQAAPQVIKQGWGLVVMVSGVFVAAN